jgi:hypothetical protein
VRAAQAVASGLTHAEAAVLVGRSARTVTRWLQDPRLRAIAERDGGAGGGLGPREVLQGALAASRANGQPDWPTRLSAVRTLTALPAQQPEPEEEPAVSIVVYDLPPGAQPVLVQHRPAAGTAEASSKVEPAPPQPAHDHLFSYHREGQSVAVGSWAPPRANQSANGVVSAQFCTTEQRETADLWRAELAAGRLPQTSDDPD